MTVVTNNNQTKNSADERQLTGTGFYKYPQNIPETDDYDDSYSDDFYEEDFEEDEEENNNSQSTIDTEKKEKQVDQLND